MIIGKKAGKNFDEIGKKWYGFDNKLEKIIYRYLCCYRIKKKELKMLGDDLRFETYQQWKQYVCNKFINYRTEELMEFSRYLNYEKRSTRPIHTYLEIVVPIVLSIMFTKTFEQACNIYYDLSKVSSLVIILLFFFVLLFILLLSLSIIKMMYPIFDNNIDENFYADYKEIIDDVIKERVV